VLQDAETEVPVARKKQVAVRDDAPDVDPRRVFWLALADLERSLPRVGRIGDVDHPHPSLYQDAYSVLPRTSGLWTLHVPIVATSGLKVFSVAKVAICTGWPGR
jgi:hypothetical protein